tara:strand:- start:843 stop:1496 length:654 start_codon:yes stop_codon:yes gene_type:complete
MSNIETTADIVERMSKTEVHQRLLKARENFIPIIGTGSGAYPSKDGSKTVIATKGDIKKCTVQALADEGLIGYFSQDVSLNTDKQIGFKYQLIHADTGQSVTWNMQMPTEDSTFWDYGSAQTYAYRFLIGDLLGLTIVDSVEQLDQDAQSAQLNFMHKKFLDSVKKYKTDGVSLEDIADLKENHKKFLSYIKDNKITDYVNSATAQIKLLDARIGDK